MQGMTVILSGFGILILVTTQCMVAGHPLPASHLDSNTPASITCLSHPAPAVGREGSATFLPITFALTDDTGKAATTICPGATYTLAEKLADTDSGRILVTTTAGSLTPGEKPAGCNGARYDSANGPAAFSQMLTVSCEDVTASSKVGVAVTYLTATSGAIDQGSATFAIDAACYAATCGGSTHNSIPTRASHRKLSTSQPAAAVANGLASAPGGRCGTPPVYEGVTWPSTCAGKRVCRSTCKAGYTGGRVTATCIASRWQVTGMCTCVARACGANPAWANWGGNLQNTRNAAQEKSISPANVARLGQAWVFSTTHDVSATPTVVGNRLLVPDWGGYMYCLNADTGALIWNHTIIDYVLSVDPAPYPSDYSNTTIISRTSPAVSLDIMVFGTMKKGGGFPYLMAANVTTGKLLWGFRVDPHATAMVTMSPTIHGRFVYVGVSSLEELTADNPDYECCTFIGSMLKADLLTGAVVWQTYTAPPNNNKRGGFSGNSVWGSSPAINPELGHVYIATGNNYEIPEDLNQCLQAVGNLTVDNMDEQLACEAKFGKGNLHNSMIALDMRTGAIRWVTQLGGPDAWNAACLFENNKDACPDLNSPDYDFAQAPMLVSTCKNGVCKKLVVAGQKSGWVWALKPEDGSVDWSLQVGPGGLIGGLQWGSAADSQRVYVSNNNADSHTVDLTKMKAVPNVPGSKTPPTSTKGGLTAAVDAFTGELLWTFANPTMHWDTEVVPPHNARSQAPMTVANGVVYYASMDAKGTLFFLQANNGKLLGSFETGATLGCGPSLARGKVFTGSGYLNFGLGQKGTKLYALQVK